MVLKQYLQTDIKKIPFRLILARAFGLNAFSLVFQKSASSYEKKRTLFLVLKNFSNNFRQYDYADILQLMPGNKVMS